MSDIARRLLAVCTLSLSLLITFAASAAAQTADSSLRGEDINLASLGLDDINVQGIANTIDVFVPKPQGALRPDGNYVRLVVSHSALLVPDVSTLTATINDTNVGAIFLTPANSRRSVVRFAVPARLLHTDQVNHLQLRFHLRLQRRICEDPDNPALNARIDRMSALHYASGAAGRPRPSLEQYPAPFVDRTRAQPRRFALRLAPAASEATLTAAMRLTASLAAQAAGQRLRPRILRSDRAAGRDEIVVGTPSESPQARSALRAQGFQIGRDGLTDRRGRRIGPGDGVLALGVAPDDRHTRLIVSGADTVGVLKAADALASPLTRPLLVGDQAVVRELRPGLPATQLRAGSTISLTRLGIDDVQFSGLGSHETSVAFVAPPVDPNGFGYLRLAYNASVLLDRRTSAISVALNGSNIGTITLTKDSSDLQQTQLRYSGRLLQPGRNALTIRYELRSPDVCRRPADEAVSASLSSSSRIELPGPTSGSPPLDLKLLPYPFLDNPRQTPTTVLLPDAPRADLDAIFDVIAALGSRSLQTAATLRAEPVSKLRNDQAGNVIAVGIDPEHRRLSSWARSRRVALQDDDVLVRSATGTVTARLGADIDQLGIVEISPAGSDHAVLWVTATSRVMLTRTTRAVWRPALTGRAVAVTRRGVRTLVSASPAGEHRTHQATAFKALGVLALGLAFAMVAVPVIRRKSSP